MLKEETLLLADRKSIQMAPYERLPLFVREGTILPVGPEIQYTDEKPANPITLFIYTGKNGDFSHLRWEYCYS